MAARNPFASSIPDAFDPYGSLRPERLSTGYYFVRNLLLVAAVVGGFVALYRNDVFRDLARRAGQEQRYLAAEEFLVGTPGWGTPRSMEPVLEGAGPDAAPPAAAAAVTDAAPAVTQAAAPAPPPPGEPPPAAVPVVAQQAAVAAPAPVAAATPSDPLAPVTLDSLPLAGKAGTPAQPVSFADLPTAHGAAPAPAPAARAAAPVAAAAPAHNGKAIKVSLDDPPASAAGGRSIPLPTRAAARPAPPPAPPPAPVAAKPEPPKVKTTDVHKNDNPLMAAVRGAVRARPAKDSVPPAD